MVTVAEVEREVRMTADEAMAAEVTTDVDVMATAVMSDVDVDVMAAVVAGVMVGVMTAVVAAVMPAAVATGRSGCGHEDGGSDCSSGRKREHRDTLQHDEGPSGWVLFSFLQPALGQDSAPPVSLARAQSSLS